ncbi:hypothetical protein [Actinoplanes palleronii]|uniref:Uncharacterized protein n=1 Tax=Actinoplanes palleronii TaxID=113570 RepID=A0ABQ4BLA9_9ACTN|nr:hypothetical protein [Actinoplanes palleronii]GIE71469.1 hypothetical protein Apa02nite_075770 [Actinoplanes palleronii]
MPTAVLTRIQSGVGALTVTAHWSEPAAGWLILAWQKNSGEQRLITPADAPFAHDECLQLDHRGDTPELRIDLRQIRTVDRILLATAPNGPPRPFTGALALTTFGGARIDLPITGTATGIAVLMTIYNVAGELVLRAEHDPIGTSLQAACLAYGYDRITWLDQHTPLR